MLKDRKANWYLGLLILVGMLVGYDSMALAFMGARALGMGGAYTAISDDCSAIFWNPAGLMLLEEPSLSSALAFYTQTKDSYASFVSYLEPDSGYGAGALSWYYGKLDPVAEPGRIEYHETHDFCYSMAKPLGNGVYWGGNLRYQREQEPFKKDSVAGWAGDVAGMVKISNGVNLGVSLRDVQQVIKGQSDELGDDGGNMLVGLAFRPDERLTIAIDGYDVLNRLQQRAMRFGGEYRFGQGLALRVGLQKGLDTTWQAWTGGAGVDLANWRVEYAYLGGDYQGIHTMAVTWRF